MLPQASAQLRERAFGQASSPSAAFPPVPEFLVAALMGVLVTGEEAEEGGGAEDPGDNADGAPDLGDRTADDREPGDHEGPTADPDRGGTGELLVRLEAGDQVVGGEQGVLLAPQG